MSEGEGCAAALSLTCDGSQDASGTLSTPQWTCGSAGVTCPGGTGACVPVYGADPAGYTVACVQSRSGNIACCAGDASYVRCWMIYAG